MSYAYLFKYIIIGDTGKHILLFFFTVTYTKSGFLEIIKNARLTLSLSLSLSLVLLKRNFRRGKIVPVVTVHR